MNRHARVLPFPVSRGKDRGSTSPPPAPEVVTISASMPKNPVQLPKSPQHIPIPSRSKASVLPSPASSNRVEEIETGASDSALKPIINSAQTSAADQKHLPCKRVTIDRLASGDTVKRDTVTNDTVIIDTITSDTVTSDTVNRDTITNPEAAPTCDTGIKNESVKRDETTNSIGNKTDSSTAKNDSCSDSRSVEQIRDALELRFLCPEDVAEVKALCSDWFPVEYPDSWYADITSDKRFYSLAAVLDQKIVGLIISEVKTRSRLHREDTTILSSAFPSATQVAYILSLGVVKDYRRKGIATAMLSNLLNYLNTNEKYNVKAVYLHVLASNTNAIRFYEKHNFRRHEYLPYYYAIRGKGKDGLSYVLYVNGGTPPWTLIDYMKLVGSYLSQMQPSAIPSAMSQRARNFLTRRRSWFPSLSFPSIPSMSLPNMSLPTMNMNILQRFRGQGQGSSQDPEAGMPDHPDLDELEDGAAGGRNKSWLPSVNYYSLLQRFGGQCYDSGEPPEFEDIDETAQGNT